MDTAGWVRCSSRAAFVKLRCRAVASNTRSWRSETLRRVPETFGHNPEYISLLMLQVNKCDWTL